MSRQKENNKRKAEDEVENDENEKIANTGTSSGSSDVPVILIIYDITINTH